MQYVGRALDSVSKTWSSINPATLSGAVDVIVVEQENGDLSCSPFHVRFGKFQLLRPSQKKVQFSVNGQKTDIPMKLSDGGEAFFVFETAYTLGIPRDFQTSPVISPSASPSSMATEKTSEPEFLDLGEAQEPDPSQFNLSKKLSFEQAQKLSEKLTIKNIPTKIDQNGDLFLDMQGYKSNNQLEHDSDEIIKNLLTDEFGDNIDLDKLIKEDQEGNIMINGSDELGSPPPLSPLSSDFSSFNIQSDDELEPTLEGTIFLKSLRLTNEQLQCLNLKPGANDIQFSVNEGRAIISARLFLWKYNVPIVISDIDGTITKSDTLGHVLTMIGKDWTHEGVSKLFNDISLNGYNIMYLTARSVGQADATRNYLDNICQDGISLPKGPVILSPDRTFAALRREVILKKPEVFKMSCLNDIKSLYGLDTLSKTPFIAGFGNRITDALSYRSVGIPSSRIFTINPDGEVHMELLELAGYKSTYIFITELVDHIFPPVKVDVIDSGNGNGKAFIRNDENFTDVNFWREPIPDLDDLSDLDDVPPTSYPSSPLSPRLGSQTLSLLPSSPNLESIQGSRGIKSDTNLVLEPKKFLDEEDDYDEEADEDYIDDEDEEDDDEDEEVIYEDEEYSDEENDDYSDEEEEEFDEEEELDHDLLEGDVQAVPAESSQPEIKKLSDLLKDSNEVVDKLKNLDLD